MVGQFKDDAIQNIFNNSSKRAFYPTPDSGWVFYIGDKTGSNIPGRFADVTRGKSKGVKYIIKVL